MAKILITYNEKTNKIIHDHHKFLEDNDDALMKWRPSIKESYNCLKFLPRIYPAYANDFYEFDILCLAYEAEYPAGDEDGTTCTAANQEVHISDVMADSKVGEFEIWGIL